jgi:hypothetical protein
MKRRGRPSNWDGIVEHVGLNVYRGMQGSGQATAKCTPSRASLMRLGKAALHACSDADAQDKMKVLQAKP